MQTQLSNPAHAFLEDKRDLVQHARVLGGALTAPPFVMVLVDRGGAALFPGWFGSFENPAHKASCAVIALPDLIRRLNRPGGEAIRQQLATYVPGGPTPTLVAACGALHFDDGGQHGQA